MDSPSSKKSGKTPANQLNKGPFYQLQVVLSVGQDTKFDVNDDDFYDIFVKLNSIENSRADITIQKVSEEVSEETESSVETEGEVTSTGEDSEDGLEKEKNLTWLWILIGVVVVIIGWFIIKKEIINEIFSFNARKRN